MRLGNIVEYNGVPCIVHGIQEVQCGIVSKDWSINACVFYSRVNPVRLTDEILTEWCGFTISPCQGFYFDVDHELQIYITRNHAISLINRQDEGEHYLLRKIRFLHELQNLLYVLTGEELKITLP